MKQYGAKRDRRAGIPHNPIHPIGGSNDGSALSDGHKEILCPADAIRPEGWGDAKQRIGRRNVLRSPIKSVGRSQDIAGVDLLASADSYEEPLPVSIPVSNGINIFTTNGGEAVGPMDAISR